MNNIKRFLDSLYLGDCYCEKTEYNDANYTMQVNCISILKKCTTECGYNYENIDHGIIVFNNVKNIKFSNDLTVNDEIYEIDVLEKRNNMYLFVVYCSNVNEDALTTDIEIYIEAQSLYIINPQNGEIIDK